jgi:NTP pyrophosphatase (non-canonical NTP hydrolase)
VGYAIFGFGFSVTGDIALTYLTDCYSEVSEAINSGTTDKLTKYLRILGDVLVWVVFIRNGLSVLIMSVYTPWISSFGIQKTFTYVAIISLAMTIIPIGLLIWVKRARERTAPKYRDLLFGNLFREV